MIFFNILRCSLAPLSRIAGIILNGMIKLIFEGEDIHKMMAYTVIGQLGQRIPSVIDKNSNLLCHLFDTLVSVCRINNNKNIIIKKKYQIYIHIFFLNCLLKCITKIFIFFL